MSIHPLWRGHLFLFDKPPAAAYSSGAGARLLIVFVLVEVVTRRLLHAGAQWLSIANRNWWSLAQTAILTALACGLVLAFARVRLSQLGLHSWRRWSKTEKFYLPQVVAIGILVFSFMLSARLKMLWARPDLLKIGLFVFVPQMIWGFYQEFLYRGILQTELTRRLGTWPGILVSNLVFTFGPLHAYHFSAAQRNPSHLWIFAAIFATGLFFAILFNRSGNLWIIAIMHGIGDWFIDGLARVSRMGLA
jgi:membrane protease YdiL (CAAX protease family)